MMMADRILWCALELQITVVGRGQFVFSCCVLCLGLRDCAEGRSKAMVLKMGLEEAIFSKYLFFCYNPKLILKPIRSSHQTLYIIIHPAVPL